MEKKNKRVAQQVTRRPAADDMPALPQSEVQRWPVFVAGVQGEAEALGAGLDVVVRFDAVCQQDAMKICTMAWNRARLWPFSTWRASCDFHVAESAGPMGEPRFAVAILGVAC